MPWLLIELPASDAEAESVADALTECGAQSVSIEGTSAEERLQSGLEPTALWSENRVTGVFPDPTDVDAALAAVRRTLGVARLPAHRTKRLDDADWGRAWMTHYQPLRVAPKLWVVPSWCAPPDPAAVNIILDPGLAFGTGTHPTTALCLTWLASQSLAGRTVIDYGCGSGILAIAALKLGAANAVGIDLDPQALAVSRENATRNGVAERFQAVALRPVTATADVVVANILAGTLIDLAPDVSACVAPRGRLGLSGVLSAQVTDVAAAYAPPFALAVEERDGWALLAGPRLP